MKHYIPTLIAYLTFFFSPIALILFTTGVLVFTDLITGVYAAKSKGEIIHSKKMARSIGKIIFYFIAIILSRLMEVTFFPVIPIANITAGYIALIEFKSNIENVGTITGIDLWKAIIDKINVIKNK
jgi:phage-related holin